MIVRTSLAVSLVFLLFACDDDGSSTTSHWPSAAQTTALSETKAQPVIYKNVMQFYGIASGGNSITKSFFAAGWVESLTVREGQFVKRGDVLARLYSPVLEEQLVQARASLEREKVNLHLDKEEYERGHRLWKGGLMAKTEYDRLKRNLDTATQAVKQAEASVSQAANQFNDLDVVADEDGLLSEIFKREGDFLGAGEPLLRFESLQHQKVTFDIPERVALTIETGETADIYFASNGARVAAVMTERSLPTAGGSPLHKITYKLVGTHPNLVGLRGSLQHIHYQVEAYQVDYRALRYDIDLRPYLLVSTSPLVKQFVHVLAIEEGMAFIRSESPLPDDIVLGNDLTLPVNLAFADGSDVQ